MNYAYWLTWKLRNGNANYFLHARAASHMSTFLFQRFLLVALKYGSLRNTGGLRAQVTYVQLTS